MFWASVRWRALTGTVKSPWLPLARRPSARIFATCSGHRSMKVMSSSAGLDEEGAHIAADGAGAHNCDAVCHSVCSFGRELRYDAPWWWGPFGAAAGDRLRLMGRVRDTGARRPLRPGRRHYTALRQAAAGGKRRNMQARTQPPGHSGRKFATGRKSTTGRA